MEREVERATGLDGLWIVKSWGEGGIDDEIQVSVPDL